MRLLHMLVISILAIPFAQTAAQQAPSGRSMQLARLNFLVGEFTTEAIMPPQPMAQNGARGTGTSVITWALDSMYLVIDEQGQNSLFGRYKGLGVLGFDTHAGQYQLFMFNNSGDHPSYQGAFAGDTLVLATHIPMSGRPFDQKLLWFKDGAIVKLRVLTDAGKGFDLVVEQTATPVVRKPD